MTERKIMCEFVGGSLRGLNIELNEAINVLKVTGRTADLSEIRKNGGCVCMEFLDNRPIFNGYLSPSYGGENTLRYESYEAYEMLSH